MTAVVPKIDSILQLIPANGFVDFETTTGPMRVPVVALAVVCIDVEWQEPESDNPYVETLNGTEPLVATGGRPILASELAGELLDANRLSGSWRYTPNTDADCCG